MLMKIKNEFTDPTRSITLLEKLIAHQAVKERDRIMLAREVDAAINAMYEGYFPAGSLVDSLGRKGTGIFDAAYVGPTQDLSIFRFTACVDWIEVRFTLPIPTTYQRIRQQSTATFVGPVEPFVRGLAWTFVARWQDPRSWNYIHTQLKHMGVESYDVTAIEIAVDAYARTAGARELLPDMCARYLKGNKNPLDNARFVRGGQGKEPLISQEQCVRRFREGWTMELGDRDASHTQRIYFKTKDSGRELPVERYRARMENTYRATSLPPVAGGSLLDIIGPNDFSFRAVKLSGNSVADLVAKRAPQVGLRQLRMTEGGPRLYAKNTQADTELNRRMQDALRSLKGRWARV